MGYNSVAVSQYCTVVLHKQLVFSSYRQVKACRIIITLLSFNNCIVELVLEYKMSAFSQGKRHNRLYWWLYPFEEKESDNLICLYLPV